MKKDSTVNRIAVVGDTDEWVKDVLPALLGVDVGEQTDLYIDSPGGGVYPAMAAANTVRYRGLNARAIVVGECSSAALLLFAACRVRLVADNAVLLFHASRWKSDESFTSREAASWAEHYVKMEKTVDDTVCRWFGDAHKDAEDKVRGWLRDGHYATAKELNDLGLATLFIP